MRKIALICFWTCAQTLAQVTWKSVVLHDPSTMRDTTGRAANGSRQAGHVLLEDTAGAKPVIWNGSATDYTLLTPSAWGNGWINGMSATHQVGVAYNSTSTHAALWSGSAESFVDLHPTGSYWYSEAFAACGQQQVGVVIRGNPGRTSAALWRGSAASFVNLNPPGAGGSSATSTDGEFQGGGYFPAGSVYGHAVMWHGTAASYVDLHPPTAFESFISGMAPGVQVGGAQFYPSLETHASLWRGSLESWRDLHPPSALDSKLNASTGTMHVGMASFGGFGRAGIWLNDSPMSYVNLHSYLPPNFIGSEALDVSVVGNTIYVVGTGGADAANQAVLWIGTIPGPGTIGPVIGGIAALSVRRR